MVKSVLSQLADAPYGAPLRLTRPDGGWRFPWTFLCHPVEICIEWWKDPAPRSGRWAVVVIYDGENYTLFDGRMLCWAAEHGNWAYLDVIVLPGRHLPRSNFIDALTACRTALLPDCTARLIHFAIDTGWVGLENISETLKIPASVVSQAMQIEDWPDWLRAAVTKRQMSYSAATILYQARDRVAADAVHDLIDSGVAIPVSLARDFVRNYQANHPESDGSTRGREFSAVAGTTVMGVTCGCCRQPMTVGELRTVIVCAPCAVAIMSDDGQIPTPTSPVADDKAPQETPEQVTETPLAPESEKAKPQNAPATENRLQPVKSCPDNTKK